MDKLKLKHRPTFLYSYVKPALDEGFIEMTLPEKPNDPNQKYTLTQTGKLLQEKIKNSGSAHANKKNKK